jgi:phytoene dehydrogenase-like protein
VGDKTYDVIVVGAGPGGAACAALLAKAGVKTLLLEKNDRPGGKALTMSREGFRYELWPVTGGPAHSSRFEELIGELELDTELLMPEGAAVLLYRDPSGEYTPYQPPGPVPLKPEEAEEVNRFFAEIVSFSPQEIEALDEITFHEFASRYRIPQSFYSFLAMEANIVFVVPIDLLAASEAVRTLQDFARGGAACYFKGGYGRIFETCADAVKRYGGEVRLRTRVEQITIKDSQVRGAL